MKKTTITFLTYLVALMLFGASNHCIFEETVAHITAAAVGIESPSHLPNHIGSEFEHTHNDTPEPHRHGHPHPLVVLQGEKSLLSLIQFMTSIIPVTFSSFLMLLTDLGVQPTVSSNNSPPVIHHEMIDDLISSLTLSSQGPPLSFS